MTLRYFAATDGKVTVFRASASRAYVCARYRPVSFSENVQGIGWMPVREITEPEYRKLIATKKLRTAGTSPQDSWVSNDALEGVS